MWEIGSMTADQPELPLTSWHSWTDLLARLSLHLSSAVLWSASVSPETGALCLSRSLLTADGSERGVALRTISPSGHQRLYLMFELRSTPPTAPPPAPDAVQEGGEASSVA